MSPSRRSSFSLVVAFRESPLHSVPRGWLNDALRAGQQLATYLDDDAAGEVYARIAEAEAEEEIRTAMRAQEIPVAEQSLRDALDEHLDALGERARRRLLTGELARHQLDGLGGGNADFEYAGPTHLYSRALEMSCMNACSPRLGTATERSSPRPQATNKPTAA